MSEELGKVAADTGVHFAGVKYDEKDAPIEGLRKLNIEISLSGDYLQEVKFINALERDKMFFLIDGIALGEQQGNVRLQLKLETYLRAERIRREAGHRKQAERPSSRGVCCWLRRVLVVRAFHRRRPGPPRLVVWHRHAVFGGRLRHQHGSTQKAHKPSYPLLAHSLDPTCASIC